MFLTPLVKQPGTYHLRNTRGGRLVAERLEVAGDSKSRRKGLLGRDRMEPGEALIIAPCGGIHTFGMRFPIDVLFVRKDGRVVKCAHTVRPWRIALAPLAYAAIELPAGTIAASGTTRGDTVALVPSAEPATPSGR